jgi:hypothetical protein
VVKATVVASEAPAVIAMVAINTTHPTAARWMPERVTILTAVDMRPAPSS